MKIAYLVIPGVLGVVIFILGLLFKLQHWPGAALLQLAGGALVLLSAFLILIKFVLEGRDRNNKNKH